MHIYTKSGDKGETGLLGGKRISKASLRIEAIGSVDELNAVLGVVRIHSAGGTHDELLAEIQSNLFTMGAQLANAAKPQDEGGIGTTHIEHLEQYIDALEIKLPKLTHFILPAGTAFAAHAHMARAVCRRAERSVIALHKTEPISVHIIIYLNRLSDLLFMLARDDMHAQGREEIQWKNASCNHGD